MHNRQKKKKIEEKKPEGHKRSDALLLIVS